MGDTANASKRVKYKNINEIPYTLLISAVKTLAPAPTYKKNKTIFNKLQTAITVHCLVLKVFGLR
jgi:hypothetical protein